jgi:hypothetical protein
MASIGVPAALSTTSTMPGASCDKSQSVGGEDSELTLKTMILRALSIGDGKPASSGQRGLEQGHFFSQFLLSRTSDLLALGRNI